MFGEKSKNSWITVKKARVFTMNWVTPFHSIFKSRCVGAFAVSLAPGSLGIMAAGSDEPMVVFRFRRAARLW